MRIVHPISPLVPENAKILILGSFPSVKSREEMFFYGHKQNRFWRVLAYVTDSPVPLTIEEKKKLLLANGIALYDVIYACDIIGSSDSSISNVVPTDLKSILSEYTSIKAVFTNGSKSHECFQKYQVPVLGREDIKLPSTSPANASFSLEKLQQIWKDALAPYL